MASIRKTLLAAALVSVLTLGAVAEAGLMCPKADVVRGTVTSFDAASGRLVVGSRTLYLSPQTVLHKKVRGHYEPLTTADLAPGQEVRAVAGHVKNRYLVRSVDVLEKVSGSQAK